MKVLIYEPTGWGSHFYYVKSLWQQFEPLINEFEEIMVLTCSDFDHPCYINDLTKLRYSKRFALPLLGGVLRKMDRLWKISVNYKRLAKSIKKFQIDIVHFQVLHKIFLPYIAVLKRRLKFKIVFTPHNIRSHNTARPIYNTLDAMLFRWFRGIIDCYIAHSHYHRQQLESKGVAAGKIRVIPYAPHLVGPRDPSKREFRSVLFAGNLRRNKGIDFFLTALKMLDRLLKEEDAPVKIYFAGRTWERDIVNQILKIRKEVRKLEIQFENRYIDNKEYSDYFNRAFILVLPHTKQFHSLSAVLLDGYHYDNELIVSDVAGNGEMIETDETGYLIPAEDASGIAEKILYVLRRGPNRDFSRGKKKALKEKYNWETISSHTLDLYRRLA